MPEPSKAYAIGSIEMENEAIVELNPDELQLTLEILAALNKAAGRNLFYYRSNLGQEPEGLVERMPTLVEPRRTPESSDN